MKISFQKISKFQISSQFFFLKLEGKGHEPSRKFFSSSSGSGSSLQIIHTLNDKSVDYEQPRWISEAEVMIDAIHSEFTGATINAVRWWHIFFFVSFLSAFSGVSAVTPFCCRQAWNAKFAAFLHISTYVCSLQEDAVLIAILTKSSSGLIMSHSHLSHF